MEEKIQDLMKSYRDNEGNIISLLQETQETFGFVPEEAVFRYSSELGIPASNFYGVLTFYAQFCLKPKGNNIITVCRGTACHVKGSERILKNLERELNLTDENNTTNDRMFTLERLACVGSCSIAPVVIINNKVHGKMTTDKTSREVRALRKTCAHE